MPEKTPENKFQVALDGFIKATQNSKQYAKECSQLAFEQFAEHGNLSMAQQFFDAMATHGNNYVRKAAFAKWLMFYAPVGFEKGKFFKDKKRKDQECHTVEAFKKDFWDFAPDKEKIVFDTTMVLQQLDRLVKRFRSDNYTAADKKDAELVTKIGDFSDMLHKNAA